MTTRPPAVAGSFYPADPVGLAATVDALLSRARHLGDRPIDAHDGDAHRMLDEHARDDRLDDYVPRPRVVPSSVAPPKALISPHAGYVFSGSTAALGFAALDPGERPITRVVVACPTHRVGVRGIALPDADAFVTPLGTIPVDRETTSRIATLPQVVVRPDVHAQEHAIEVQLPFLQRVLDEFSLVPLAVGDVPPEVAAAALDACWGGPETLVIVSSDLSHYHPYEQARSLDQDTVARILRVEGPVGDQRACGVRALNGLLAAAPGHRLRPTLLGMCNSGDTRGDRSGVVGYASIAWHEGARREDVA
ncbi:AmmeMemoRadiSam system protein B [Brooklawnia cerclae]|uniref:MEMO1 family protein FB473_002888 n=1 Tax=Brooklawnia cerclae TaxID=349934 RepID=A0ABX0SN51_9ACTN|nr:AmmeMemoRadiSam system protein B [Brooklawnia cerclae]NIH58196.1 hypothetical protein [Brooklawnia cerclae]